MKRMLFNATHQEELRVAVVDGQKLIDLDVETAGREQRKGNIYKGVVTRIEPGLEACFVNYGEERHGFLPFKDVARDYFKEGVDIRTARIQDALHEGQELVVQVEKEERGNKGAALTTFVSLAGRFLVLMPNNPRGGGISRRIEAEERQELRQTLDQLALPEGMGIIARTAGIGRTVEELQWDLSYLVQLWNAIDGAARENKAPVLIYLESSLVIRAIRDYFSPDIGEILIDTPDIAEQAKAFMGVVMPENLPHVKLYTDDVPLFSRFQIEHQIETAYARTVPLPSGGSIVIDHTEALVAIDVNSARSIRGADIEETAVRTNLEAADEVARQLRLRDLGGLVVIDFIDMGDTKNRRMVEQRLYEAVRVDRARLQLGKISRFGMMELSRQRLRPALSEGSHITCPRCNGTGVIRDAESSALQVLRLLEEEAMKDNTAALLAQLPVDVATFLLNEKRSDITKMESRLKVNLLLIPNKNLETPHHAIERLRHDDPRMEALQSSFQLVQHTGDTPVWTPGKETDAKPRPEALVKRTAPTEPAPVVSSKRAQPPRKPAGASSDGLLRRVWQWLAGASGKQAAASSTQPTRNNRRGATGERTRSQADRPQQRRGSAHAAIPRSDTSQAHQRRRTRPQTSADASQAGSEQAQTVVRSGQTPAQQTPQDGVTREPRQRRYRNRRGESDNLSHDVAETAPQALPEESVQIATLEQDAAFVRNNVQTEHLHMVQETPEAQDTERRRRSRRGRRGSRNGEATAVQSQEVLHVLESADQDVVSPAVQAVRDAVDVTPAPSAIQEAVADSVPVVSESVPVIPDALPALAEPVATLVETPAAPEPVAPPSTGNGVAPTLDSVIGAASAPLVDEEELQANEQQASPAVGVGDYPVLDLAHLDLDQIQALTHMQLVQTQPGSAQQETPAKPAPPLGRARKPVVPVDAVPLQQVETH